MLPELLLRVIGHNPQYFSTNKTEVKTSPSTSALVLTITFLSLYLYFSL